MNKDVDWQMEKKSLNERVREIYKLSKWTDCMFSVGETKVELIKCHKLMLAASSPVFEALFYGPMANVNEKAIRLPDLEPATFKLLLEYVYCDSVEISDIFEAGFLLYASKKYMLPHLTRICIDYIIQHVQISNLHDVLEIAESLNEEELLDTCLKIMGQYSVDIWASASEHLSKTMLCRLLDQDASNSSEFELWNFVISWAETECELNSVDPTPEEIRSVIDKLGLLQRIRFLTFSNSEFIDFVKPTRIISDSELAVLNACIKSIETDSSNRCDFSDCDNRNRNFDSFSDTSDKCDFSVPKGFNSNSNKRMRVSTCVNHCPRKILTKRKTWTYGGTVCTKITSETHVLVTGFEVFTRIPSTADFCMSHGKTGHYTERLVVKICDEEGSELSKTDYNGIAEFNASQNVKLAQPIWFHPGRKYSVTFELPAGQYPLSQLSGFASSKIANFQFEDFTNYPEGYLDFSFICALMFSL